MKYLASIEACPYFLWQIELLIESFKLHNMQDDLVIAVATRDKGIEVCKNFGQHGNKFFHINRRDKEGAYFNKPYATTVALEKKYIEKENYVLIEPDMVLVKPLKESDVNITYANDQFYTKELLESEGYAVSKIMQEILTEQSVNDPMDFYWPFLGGVVQFKNVDDWLFKRILHWGNKIKNKNAPLHGRYVAKTAWVLTFFESFDAYTFKSENYESTMEDFDTRNFIHYYHGYPPVFNKQVFQWGKKWSLSGHTPFESLLMYNPTPATDYMQKIIMSACN